MTLVCLTFHHIKTSYDNFRKIRFKEAEEFYDLTEGVLENRILLQTGTRVEIYTIMTDIYREVEKILELLEEKSGLDKETLKDFFKILLDNRAIEHLFRLTSCIESRVMGETYIPWQVEGGLKKAKELETAEGPLVDLFEMALSLSKEAKEKTNIEGDVPVAQEAAGVVLDEIQDLKGKTLVLLGSGLIGIRTARMLKEKGIKNIFVINRNLDIGMRTALELGAASVPYNEKEGIISRADILICATLASHYRVTEELLPGKQKKDLVIVDVSPFGNVDPEVGKLPGIILKDGKIREALEKNFLSQKEAVPEVEKIIQKAMDSQIETGSF